MLTPAPSASSSGDNVQRIRGVTGERAVAAAHEALRGGSQRLDLDGCVLLDQGIALLASAPEIAQAQVLILANNQISGKGLAVFLAKASLPNLQTLELDFNELSESGMQALAQASLPRLQRLSLRGVLPGGAGIAIVAAAGPRAMPQLRSLDLGENQLTDADLAPLLRSRWVQPLQTIQLDQNRLTRSSVSRLAALRDLRRLDLSGNELELFGVRALIRAAFLGRIGELALRYTRLNDRGIRELASKLLPAAPRLWNLDLTSTGLTTHGLLTLLSSAKARQLTQLSLSHNRLGNTAIAQLAKVELPALVMLRLDACELGDPGVQALAKIKAPRLQKLSVADNQLTEAGLGAILGAAGLPQLAELDLRGNRIGSLAPLLALPPVQARALRKVQLQGNPLPDNAEPQIRPNLSLEMP